MTDRPILFSGSMVRALLDGRKTQTRRVLSNARFASIFNGEWADSYVLDPGNASWRDQEARYRVGDRLYVREAWRVPAQDDKIAPRDLERQIIGYEADCVAGQIPSTGKFRQAMHMPRWASRLMLPVSEVRVQRLQDISEADAKAEGMTGEFCDYELYGQSKPYRYEFCGLWDSLNAGRGFGWETNPWVVAVTFTVERRNIDEVPA